MFESINSRLSILREQVCEKEKLESLLFQHEQDLESLYAQLPPLEAQLERETNDLKRLESFSFSNLFLTLCGDLEDRVLEEQQLLATCRMKYDETYHSIHRLEERIDILRKKLAPFSDADCIYQQMMATKEALIKEAHLPCEKDLIQLTKERDLMAFTLKELQNVLTLINKSLCFIENIGNTLKTADFNMPFEEHSGNLNQLHAQARNVQELLITLKAELANVPLELPADISAQNPCLFMETFLDNLVSVLFIPSEIELSIQHIQKIKNVLVLLKKQLQKMTQKNKKDFEKLTITITDTICTAS